MEAQQFGWFRTKSTANVLSAKSQPTQISRVTPFSTASLAKTLPLKPGFLAHNSRVTLSPFFKPAD